VTDAISSVAAPWPGAMGTILPGGFTVSGNKFYVFGGFNINIGMTDAIWQFTPSPAGWVQKSSHLPTALGYIPTTTIGSLIYTAGGSTWDGTTLHDSTASFVFDPVADTINNIASIPRATAETRALNFNNQMLVMGGGRDAPNPSNEVDVYDPGTNTWSTSISPFATARRNFGTDTNGTTTIWVAGGYASDGVTPLNSMEIFECTSTSDTVTITKAVYKTSNSQLLVQANDSDPSAVLTVTVTSSGEQLGRMQTRGDGRYQLKKGGIANPLNITVTSSLGGTDSSNVRSR
jgi:N-acetylneuraminic acid mutarotase